MSDKDKPDKIEELAEKLKKRHCWPRESMADAYEAGFENGYNAALSAQSGSVEFDEKAAINQTLENQWAIECTDCGSLMPDTRAFVRGARWQFEQSRAELAEKDKRIAELEYNLQRLNLDCGASNCRYAKDKSGMRTNGGCHCADNIKSGQQAMALLDSANAKLERAREALKFASIENASRREVAFCAAETLAEIEGDE